MTRPDVTGVVVDLRGVTFLDSSALGVLVVANKSCRQRGLTFGVRDPGPMATMVLRITGLFDELILPAHGSNRPRRGVGDTTNTLSPA